LSPERVAAAFALPSTLPPNLVQADVPHPPFAPPEAASQLISERPECEPLRELFMGYPDTLVAYQHYGDQDGRTVQVYLNVSTGEAEIANIKRIRTAGATLHDGCLTALMTSFQNRWSRAPSTVLRVPGLKVDDQYWLHSSEVRVSPDAPAEATDTVHVRVGGARLVIIFQASKSAPFTQAEVGAVVEEIADVLIAAESAGQ
jgi:hypothetical protein